MELYVIHTLARHSKYTSHKGGSTVLPPFSYSHYLLSTYYLFVWLHQSVSIVMNHVFGTLCYPDVGFPGNGGFVASELC